MRRAAFLVLAALLAAAPASAKWEVRIQTVENQVQVQLKGAKAWVDGIEDMVLHEGDTLKTGPDGQAELTLGVGGGYLELQKSSIFTVARAKQEDTILGLQVGLLLAKINKLTSRSRLAIRTPTAVAAVRGTEFAVQSEGDKAATRVGVFDEGELAVASNAQGSVVLKPNQETQIDLGKSPTSPQALRYFTFAHERMAQIRRRHDYFMKRFKNKYRFRSPIRRVPGDQRRGR